MYQSFEELPATGMPRLEPLGVACATCGGAGPGVLACRACDYALCGCCGALGGPGVRAGRGGVVSGRAPAPAAQPLQAAVLDAFSAARAPRPPARALLAALAAAAGAPALITALRGIAAWVEAPRAGDDDGDASVTVGAITELARAAMAAGDRGWGPDVAAEFGAVLKLAIAHASHAK